jgi:hypothetical protein
MKNQSESKKRASNKKVPNSNEEVNNTIPEITDNTNEKKSEEPEKVLKKKSASKKSPKKEKETIEISPEIELQNLIYGKEEKKHFFDFLDSDLQLQTKNILKEYGINRHFLPFDISFELDKLSENFNYFVQNKNEVGMIGVIMDKDLEVKLLLESWIAEGNRSELLLKAKKESVNDNETKTSEVKTIVETPNNQQAPVPVSPQNSNSGIQNMKVHDTNPLIPRTPESTYQHNINQNASTNTPNPLGNLQQGHSENKNIHYEMLNKANPYADAFKQQQHMMQPVQQNKEKQIDKKELLSKYTETIYEAVKSDFRFNMWGYVPIDIVQGILNNSVKNYSYEIIRNGDEACISVSDGQDKFFTKKFITK